MAESFSLVDRPWIRCQLTDGTEAEVSIRQVFDGSTGIRGVRGDSPTQDYAVLRLLLAIYWRAHVPDAQPAPGETYDHELWFSNQLEKVNRGEADETVLAYLSNWSDRFDLLHPEWPFMQVSDLHTKSGYTKPICYLVPDAKSEFFTMRSGDGRESVTLAESARWLVHLQAFDHSGIKTGAMDDPRVKQGKLHPRGTAWSGMTGGTVILGKTIRHTLLFNTVEEALAREDDLPVWEREPDGAAGRKDPTPKGAADLATWQSRRVRLFVEAGRVTSVLVCVGDRILNRGAEVMDDPMTPYICKESRSNLARQVWRPLAYDASRTVWTSLEALLLAEGDVRGGDLINSKAGGGYFRRPRTLDQIASLGYGVGPEWVNLGLVSVEYLGKEKAKVKTTVSARIELPRSLLAPAEFRARRTVVGQAAVAQIAAKRLGEFAGRLLEAAGGNFKLQPSSSDALLKDLEREFLEWIGKLGRGGIDQGVRTWQLTVREVTLAHARAMLRGAGPKALVGRTVSGRGARPVAVVSAGSAYRDLQRALYEALPAISKNTSAETNEEN